MSYTYHIRTAGIALFAGVLFYLFIEKKWKGVIAVFTGFSILALPWYLRGKALGLSSSYQSQLLKINPYHPELGKAELGDFVTRFGNNFVRYVTKEIPSGILPFLEINYKETPDWSGWTAGSILILLCLFGLYKLPKYRSLMVGYLGGTFAILMLWPDVWSGTRFLLPLIPVLILLVVISLSWILEKGSSLFKIKTHYISFLLLPFIFLYTQQYQQNQDQKWQSYPLSRLHLESKNTFFPKWKNYFEIAKFAKANLKTTDIIACRKPQLFHIYSDRFTTLYPFEEDDKKLLKVLKNNNVKYVVVDQLGFSSTGRYLIPAINKNSGNFKRILHLKNPDTYLFQFIPPQ